MKHYFRPYLDCKVFIETGTANGDGVIAALNAGFPKIYSIEISEHYYNQAIEFFNGIPEVELLYGNSLDILPKLLQSINERCVFWLDAHWCGGETGGKSMGIPLMQELKIIKHHHIKNHTILVDDIDLLRKKEDEEWNHADFCTCDIEEFIYMINPNYKIRYLSTAGACIYKDTIFEARV